MNNIEQKLKEATMDPKKAVEIASELAISYLGPAHEKADDMRVELAKHKLKIKDDNPKMSIAEVEIRVEASDVFREYLRAKHKVERIEEFIRVAKKHVDLNAY